jgi:hypothetical protein
MMPSELPPSEIMWFSVAVLVLAVVLHLLTRPRR